MQAEEVRTQEPKLAVPVEDEPTSLVLADRASFDVQVATAKRYPRSVVLFKRAALEMATMDEDTAGSMFYAIPRAGKTIEGPSVRLAEVVAVCWGNLRCRARTADEGEKMVTAVGDAWDLQSNYAQSIEVTRKIVDKNGRRFSDDMVNTTKLAAVAIAKRSAIFAVVPMAYIRPIYMEAQVVAVGKALTMDQRRAKAVEFFTKLGMKEPELFKLLGIKGSEDLTLERIVTLRGFATALKDGETSLDEVRRVLTQPVETDAAMTAADVVAGTATGKDDQQPGKKEK